MLLLFFCGIGVWLCGWTSVSDASSIFIVVVAFFINIGYFVCVWFVIMGVIMIVMF